MENTVLYKRNYKKYFLLIQNLCFKIISFNKINSNVIQEKFKIK